jgi:hypothetical protein
MAEAIDCAIARLERSVGVVLEKPQAQELRHRDESWHHGDEPAHRRAFYPRPREERALVRRKTFAMAPESLEDALFDLERLDHDFFLFVHDETKEEAIVYRMPGGTYGVSQREATPEAIACVGPVLQVGPAPTTMPIADALTALDETEAPFVFFVEPDTGRGNVVYRRYDGHYGLITPN